MKKLIALVFAATIAACSDQCTSVVDGTETQVDCEVADVVTSTDVVVDTGTSTGE